MTDESLLIGRVLGPGPSDWWDSERVSSPQVMRLDDGSYRMWYYGRDPEFDRMINLPTGRVGTATSADGIHWDRVKGPLTMGSVFEPDPDPDRFDSSHVGISDIMIGDGLYWMWYFGGDQQVVEIPMNDKVFKVKGIQMRPGCAISRDGLNWTRLEGPYRGAMLDVGAPGAFDATMAAWPRVIREDDGTFKMYYHALDRTKGRFIVGLATSPDGFRWERYGEILGPDAEGTFDERGISCRHVIKHDGQYLMFYEATNSGGYYCIGLATSADGVTWIKDDANPIFCHAPKGSGRWDARAVGTPCVVKQPDGSFRMYYIGANEGGHDELSTRHQIGMAVSDGPNFRKWRRWNEE